MGEVSSFEQYGILGLIVVCLAGYIMYLHKTHRSERKEWREDAGKNLDRQERLQERTNDTMKDVGGILQGLKTMLENK